MTLVVGCYERFLFGYTFPELHSPASPDFKRVFTYAAHKSAVRCSAADWPFLVSGGADDQIHLYDMRRKQDLGFLVNPGEGAIPCIDLYRPADRPTASHMFTGSADGSISVWEFGGSWVHLRVLKGHKASVNSVSVHPSGKLALSVAHNHEMRMWNLMKGRCTYTAKLDIEGDFIKFLHSGTSFVVGGGKELRVQGTDVEGQTLATLQFDRRVLCCEQLSEVSVCLGLEDGSLKLCDIRSGKVEHSIDRAHTTRIKGLVSHSVDTSEHAVLFSVASDGVVKEWDARKLGSSSSCFAHTETKARLTCACIAAPKAGEDVNEISVADNVKRPANVSFAERLLSSTANVQKVKKQKAARKVLVSSTQQAKGSQQTRTVKGQGQHGPKLSTKNDEGGDGMPPDGQLPSKKKKRKLGEKFGDGLHSVIKKKTLKKMKTRRSTKAAKQ